jgi:hypothetical protein
MSFESSLQHLLAEIERIDLLIQIHLNQSRETLSDSSPFAGVIRTEDEIDRLLEQPLGAPRWIHEPADWSAAHNRLAQFTQSLETRTQQSLQRGVFLRLVTLGYLFGLPRTALDILLVCLAPELDTRYGEIYAYLQNDVSRRHPTIDLILNLLCPDFGSKLAARMWFAETSPLLRHRLLHITHNADDATPLFLNRIVKLDPRIVSYLLEQDVLDSNLRDVVDFIVPSATLESLVLPDTLTAQIRTLAQSPQQSLMIYLRGEYGSGRQTAVEALCHLWKQRVLSVDIEKLVRVPDFENAVLLTLREAMLTGARLCWQGIDVLLKEDRKTLLDQFLRPINAYDELMFFTGETVWQPENLDGKTLFVCLSFPRPDYVQRLQLWAKLLPNATEDLCIPEISNTFRFTAGQIRDAIITAKGLLTADTEQRTTFSYEHLLEACRLQSNRRLSTLAQSLKSRYSWDDIVLPEAQKRILWEMYNQMRHRWRVYHEWGFDRKLSLGKGLNVLFAGPSGTGKTMAAEIIASALGLDLYKIDLSTVISKYIGDTEKHLAQIFNEAQSSNSILFFDEADAVFGKRSEVSDAHDRFANIQVSFLLQRMEEYDGVVILTTNLRKNMDEAFVRRMHFIVEFPFPQEAYRLQIWRHIFPTETPLNSDIDLKYIARQFELTGGNIRNIAVAAAFFAADEGQSLNMKHLLLAIQREYQKMGKVMTNFEHRP